ncbi:hypothetical protein [Pseudoalteromonas spongiae]|uniref:Phage abortive infection protein n=1 Tax=Pseudoalteromonas spongiae TaxID=298657 RepID=A0ABU8ERN1_9GAMM
MKEKMKPREWLYIIFIVILLQFIVQAAAWLYGGNSGALGYISFAGTVVSIILAVLAIVYSYIQSLSQQNSATQISSQVDKLMSVTERMDLSKNDLSLTLDHLKKVSEKIDITIDHQHQIKEQVESLTSEFSEIDFESLLGSDRMVRKYAATQKNSDDYYDKPFSGGYVGLSYTCIFLYYAEKHNFEIGNVVNDFVMQVFSEFIDFEADSDRKSFFEFQEGNFVATYQLLASMDFMYLLGSGDDALFALNDKFKSACEEFIEFALSEDDEDDEDSTQLLKRIIECCQEF